MPRQHPIEQRLNRHIGQRHRQLRRVEPREIQQVADDAFETQRFFTHDCQVSRPRRVIERELRHRQRLDVAAYGGERSHQLVRDIGQELAPDAIGRQELFLTRRQVGTPYD